jgi:hypothetical protein
VQPDLTNVETPDWIAGGSALLLFIALFLPWTHVKITGGIAGFKVTANAGASFGWIQILSVLAVVAVLALTIFDVELPFPTGLGYLGAGGLSVLLTVLVMLFRPIGASVPGVSRIPWYGAFIGLIAGIGILVGGLVKFKEQRY